MVAKILKDEDFDDESTVDPQLIISQSLSASHKVLHALSKSKEQLEGIVEKLPQIFFIIDDQMRVYKANSAAAALKGFEEDQWLNKNLDLLFCRESLSVFKSKLIEHKNQSTESVLSFELPVSFENREKCDYLWRIARIAGLEIKGSPAFSVVGSDISNFRSLERQLSNIFSAVPLGIFILDDQWKIVGPHSHFTATFFNDDNYVDQDILSLLISENPHASQSDKDGISELKLCMHEDEMWFSFAQNRFPREIRVNKNDQLLYADLQFHPICSDSEVTNILVVVGDITEVVKSRQSNESEKSKLAKKISYYSSVENTDHITLQSIISEFPKHLENFKKAVPSTDIKQAQFSLHTIKSLLRATGLMDFTEQIHLWESEIETIASTCPESANKKLIEIEALVQGEWDLVQSLIQLKLGHAPYISGSFQPIEDQKESLIAKVKSMGLNTEHTLELVRDITAIGNPDFKDLQDFLQKYADKISKELQKNVEIHFEWHDSFYAPKLDSFFREIFMHLITNIIDHGLENTDERTSKGKPPNGRIWIKSELVADSIHIEVTDDGKGFDLNKIREKAISKGMIKANDQTDVSLDILLSPGFSTKDTTNRYSGRGVGLSTIDQSVKDLGGGGLQIFQTQKGAGFKFSIPS